MARIRGIVGRIIGGVRGIIGRIRGRRQVAPTQWDWGYRCEWYDAQTGINIGNSWHVVTIESNTNYQRASAAARRWNLQHPPGCVVRHLRSGGTVRLQCQRRGPIVGHT